MTKWRHGVTSCDVMTLHHMMSYDMTKWTCPGQPIWKSENHVFQPSDRTLTFDLWPSNFSKILSRLIPTPNFESVRSMVQPGERWQTDRQTHTHIPRRNRFHILDRWRGREWKKNQWSFFYTSTVYPKSMHICVKHWKVYPYFNSCTRQCMDFGYFPLLVYSRRIWARILHQ